MELEVYVLPTVHPEVKRTIERLVSLYNSWDKRGGCRADKYYDEYGKVHYCDFTDKTELLNTITSISGGICLQFLN